jgi:hypothetical protein
VTGIGLAKPFLDVGVYTNRLDGMRAFYEGEVGLPYEELLRAGGGVHQHRLDLRGAVFKLNHSRDALPEDPTCYRRLVVAAAPGQRPARLTDPDGLAVHVVRAGGGGVETAAIAWASRDPDRLGRLLAEGLGARHSGGGRWHVGRTVLVVEHDPAAGPMGPMRARGLRYLTVQVRDVRAEHARLLDLGWSEGRPPRRLGDVAFISFVRDPDGAWLEVSQRASLTGPLPPG